MVSFVSLNERKAFHQTPDISLQKLLTQQLMVILDMTTLPNKHQHPQLYCYFVSIKKKITT